MARIEGEPLASPPVARCILEQARAIRIPKFDGDEFTLHQSIVPRARTGRTEWVEGGATLKRARQRADQRRKLNRGASIEVATTRKRVNEKAAFETSCC